MLSFVLLGLSNSRAATLARALDLGPTIHVHSRLDGLMRNNMEVMMMTPRLDVKIDHENGSTLSSMFKS